LAGADTSFRVLLVDDEPDILHIFGDALQRNGFRVTNGDSFLSAFAVLHETKFDLLILDKITGFVQVLERFRALMPGAPVLLISGSPDSADDKSLMEGKLDRVIQKPIGAVALLAHVYACLPTLGADRKT